MCQFAQGAHERTAETDALAASACFGAGLHACCMAYLDHVPAALAVAAAGTMGSALSADTPEL